MLSWAIFLGCLVIAYRLVVLMCFSFFSRYHDTIECYDEASDVWEIIGEMPTSRSWLSCVAMTIRKDLAPKDKVTSCIVWPQSGWMPVVTSCIVWQQSGWMPVVTSCMTAIWLDVSSDVMYCMTAIWVGVRHEVIKLWGWGKLVTTVSLQFSWCVGYKYYVLWTCSLLKILIEIRIELLLGLF